MGSQWAPGPGGEEGPTAAGGGGPNTGPLGRGHSRGRRAAAGVPGRRVVPPVAGPPVLPDCLHLHPFLLAPAPCSWQGLRWGFQSEEVTWFSGEDTLCILNLSSGRTSLGTPWSCRSTCCRDAIRGPALGPCAFCCHRAGRGGLFSRGGSGTLPLAVCSSASSPSVVLRAGHDWIQHAASLSAARALGVWRVSTHAQGRRHSQRQMGSGPSARFCSDPPFSRSDDETPVLSGPAFRQAWSQESHGSARFRWLRVSQSAVSFSCRHARALCPHCCRLGVAVTHLWGWVCAFPKVLSHRVPQITLDCPVSALELLVCLLQYVDVRVPSLGRSPGVGNGNPLQCSCLEEPVDGGAWQGTDAIEATLHRC